MNQTPPSWYLYSSTGELIGPFATEQIQAMIDANQIAEHTQLSLDGRSFAPASACVPELFQGAQAHQPADNDEIELEEEGTSAPVIVRQPGRQSQPTPNKAGNSAAVRKSPAAAAPMPMPEHYWPSRPIATGNVCICPHCWTVFPIEDALFVARSPGLLGDPLLGSGVPRRFKASRFTTDGRALDPSGTPCDENACPNCHLKIPCSHIEMPSEFFSIIGAPGSGKSYFLASLTRGLRVTLPSDFGFTFSDADSGMNGQLTACEEALFHSPDPGAWVRLEKTRLESTQGLYSNVNMRGQNVLLPQPFIFTLRSQNVPGGDTHNPVSSHPAFKPRSLVFYDNSGEHFLPGMDIDSAPCKHLMHSRCLFFLFDPMQSQDSNLIKQDVVLNQAAGHVRHYLHLPPEKKASRQLIVIVTKFDLWEKTFTLPLRPRPVLNSPTFSVVDLGHLEDVSFALRTLLQKTYPEIVLAAENFSDDVTYLPVSALGHSPSELEGMEGLYVRPMDIKPVWPAVAVLYALAKAGFIRNGAMPVQASEVKLVRYARGMLICKLEDGSEISVPSKYVNRALHNPATGQIFIVPQAYS